MVTRCLAELLRLGTVDGRKRPDVLWIERRRRFDGDLFQSHSRNRKVGERLGRGESLGEITAGMQMVAEGIPTTKSAFECGRRFNMETPIIDQIHAILYENKPPAQALNGSTSARAKTGTELAAPNRLLDLIHILFDPEQESD